MDGDSGQRAPVWMAHRELPDPGPLPADLRVDVCVIGAGIAGLSTAYTLARQGVSVAVLDRGRVGLEDAPLHQRAGQQPHQLRILPAEDTVVNQRVAVTLLQQRGHRVVVAGRSPEKTAVRSRAPTAAGASATCRTR